MRLFGRTRGERSTRGRLIAVLAVLAVLAVGGAAWAYFTSSGSGSGHASTGTMSTVTLSATAGNASTPLYPGGTGDVSLEVNNPNAYAVTLVSVAIKVGGSITSDSGHLGCTTTGVTFTNQSGLTTTIPASATNDQIHLSGAVSMSTSSLSSCQGATFSIPVTITVEKQ
jgi:hypothetical protein